MRFYTVLLLVLSLALGGCLGSGSDSASDPATSGLSYYYAEFENVPIPNEMSPEKSDTYVTHSGEMKLGTQLFKGRVEIASLVNAMQGHLQRDGWSLRSFFRSPKGAILIFEQQPKICSIYIYEDIINTGMLVFVSPRLNDGAVQSGVPQTAMPEPLGPSDPVIGSGGNVTTYPAR